MSYLVVDFIGKRGVEARFLFDGKKVIAAKGSDAGIVGYLKESGVLPPGCLAKNARQTFPKDGELFMRSLRYNCGSYSGVEEYTVESLEELTSLGKR